MTAQDLRERKVISINIQNIHESARVLVEDHIQKHLKDNQSAEGYIRQGLEQIVDSCPFCGQSLDGAQKLICAYQEYFDESHSQAIEKIKEQTTVYFKWDPSADFLKVKGSFDKCLQALKQIEDRLNITISKQIPSIDFEVVRFHALSVKDKVLDALSQKEQKLNLELNLQFLMDFENEVKAINAQIDIANNLFEEATQATNEQLEKINAQSVGTLENRKIQLTELRKRFSPQEKTWCDEYRQLEIDFQAAGAHCRDLTEKLSQYSLEIFKKYQAGINQVLEDLGVDFKVGNLVEQVDKRAKQPFAEFQIIINGLSVTLQEREDCPCFQNTLSDGEKNTLSFAFFVTCLRQRGNLSNTIVIFDDPLSSMDDHRRVITANIIRELAKETKQMVVLTHKRDFLILLSEKLEAPQILSLKKDNQNGSTIIPFDVEAEKKSDHQRTIEKLERYLDEDFCETKSIQGDIRPCLESALRFKYYRYLRGILTLGKILDILEERKKLESGLIRNLRDLNDVSNPVHHGEHDEDPKREMDRAELLPYVKKTLKVLELI